MSILKTLVAKDLAYAAKSGGGTIADINELDLLDNGAIACFTADGRLVTAATTANSIAGVQQFYIVVGGPNGAYNRKSYHIDRDAHIQEYCVYSAPQAQIVVVGEDGSGNGSMNLPTTLIPGTEAILSVLDRTKGWHEAAQIQRYSYVVKVGDTAEEVIQGLVDAINNRNDSIVNAAVIVNGPTKVGINLTGKLVTTDFEVSTDEIAVSATKFYETNGAQLADEGKGTFDIIKRLEDEGALREGDSNYMYLNDKFFSAQDFVASGGTYNTWNFGWTQEMRQANLSHRAVELDVVVAVPSGAAALLAALTTIFGVLFTGQSTGSGTSPLQP